MGSRDPWVGTHGYGYVSPPGLHSGAAWSFVRALFLLLETRLEIAITHTSRMALPTPPSPPQTWQLRLALESDVPELEALIPLSVRSLQSPYYTQAQMNAALGPVFGVDRQLIRDGTYFVAESAGVIVGCGGWSRRSSLYGGDGQDPLLDPQRDAARVRAFFVHPAWARRGIGRAIMVACEQAIIAAGFQRVDIVATLAGEPLYATFGYAVVERYEIPMRDSLSLPVVLMTRSLESA